MADKQSLEFSTNLEPRAAADYLEALARGLREGRLLVESGDKSLNLEVANDVSLEFEAKTTPEKSKSSVEISLSWRLAEPEAPAPPSLLITSGARHDNSSSSSSDEPD
jgi:amphi-Trp domain-containing protein